jgi:hypothetical protein
MILGPDITGADNKDLINTKATASAATSWSSAATTPTATPCRRCAAPGRAKPDPLAEP